MTDRARPAAPGRSAGGALPALAFAVCALVWSSTFLFVRIGNDSLPPVWAATMRLAAAAVLLALIALATRQSWPRGRALAAALAFGAVDFGISLPLLYWGEQAVPSALAAVLFASMPLLTMLFVSLIGLERVRAVQVLAGLAGMAGVAVMFGSELLGHMPMLPLVAVFLSAATAALAGVLLKLGPSDASPISINAIAHGAGAPLCAVASLALHEPRALPATAGGWTSLLYLTLVGSVFVFAVFAWLVQRWSVTRISFVAVITPVLATVLGAVVRHERLGPGTALGGAMVIAAVVIAITGGAREDAVRGRPRA